MVNLAQPFFFLRKPIIRLNVGRCDTDAPKTSKSSIKRIGCKKRFSHQGLVRERERERERGSQSDYLGSCFLCKDLNLISFQFQKFKNASGTFSSVMLPTIFGVENLDFFKKMGHSRPLFLYFRLFNTVDRNKCSI